MDNFKSTTNLNKIQWNWHYRCHKIHINNFGKNIPQYKLHKSSKINRNNRLLKT